MDTILGIATLLGGITAILFFWDRFKAKGLAVHDQCEKSKQTDARIKIKLGDALQKANVSIGLLHVRDGKDQISDHGPLLNKEITPEMLDGFLVFKVSYTESLGFQFKCFVDYSHNSYPDIKTLLEKSGFILVSEGGGKANRAWFLLSTFEVCVSSDGYANNFFLPV